MHMVFKNYLRKILFRDLKLNKKNIFKNVKSRI